MSQVLLIFAFGGGGFAVLHRINGSDETNTIYTNSYFVILLYAECRCCCIYCIQHILFG